MLKKIAAFIAACIISFNAAASYTKYDFSYDATGSGLSGFIVQRDDDKSIAYFDFWLGDAAGEFGWRFYPWNNDGSTLLTGATTSFIGAGPTNFTIDDNYGSDHFTQLSVNFFQGADGQFSYTANYFADLWVNMPPVVKSGTVSGTAVQGIVSPELAEHIDTDAGGAFSVPHIVPEYVAPAVVPEPASLALFGVGAFACCAMRRARRRALVA